MNNKPFISVHKEIQDSDQGILTVGTLSDDYQTSFVLHWAKSRLLFSIEKGEEITFADDITMDELKYVVTEFVRPWIAAHKK